MSLTSDRGWTPASGVETRTDKNGTSYQFMHGDQLVRIRLRDDGIVHLYLRGGHYGVTRAYQPPAGAHGGRGTSLDLVPIEYVEDTEEGPGE